MFSKNYITKLISYSVLLGLFSLGIKSDAWATEAYSTTQKTDTGILKTTTTVIKKKPARSSNNPMSLKQEKEITATSVSKNTNTVKKPTTNKFNISKNSSTVKTNTGSLKTTTIVKSPKTVVASTLKSSNQKSSKVKSTAVSSVSKSSGYKSAWGKSSTPIKSESTKLTSVKTSSTSILASASTGQKTPWWQFWKQKNSSGNGGSTGGTTGTAGSISLSGPTSLRKGVCSFEAFHVTSSSNKGTAPIGTMLNIISLSSSFGSSMNYYSDANCTTMISSVKVAIGYNSTSDAFYVIDKSTGGAWTLSAKDDVNSISTSMTGSTLTVFNVATSYGASGNGSSDDSEAFQKAIDTASAAAKSASTFDRYESGPGKAPQSIVYVPKGVYRVLGVNFKSNVRMEIDAGAELRAVKNTKSAPTMFNLDAEQPSSKSLEASLPPVKNISIVGVGTNTTGKFVYPSPAPAWDVSHSFTINDDPIATGVEPGVIPLYVRYVDGLLLQNIYSIQNNSDPSNKTNGKTNSNGAVIVFKMSENSPEGDENGSRYDAHNVIYANHYNIHSPGGYGPNQIQTVTNLNASDIFSDGGVTLRMESDQSTNTTAKNFKECTASNPCKPKYGAMIYNVTANNIQGYNCNAAVYFAAHGQTNKKVALADVRSDNCYMGISQSSNTTADPGIVNGAFLETTLDSLHVIGSNMNGSGTNAQDPNSSQNTFTVSDTSNAVVAIGNGPKEYPWSVGVSKCTYSGDFASKQPAGDNACVKSSNLVQNP